MISGPEMARLVSEFEASMTTEVEVQGAYHHEVQRSFQVSFFKDVKSLVTTIEDFGNPFLEEIEDLIVLAPVVQTVDNAIHRINHYPLDIAIGFAITYPVDSDLSG